MAESQNSYQEVCSVTCSHCQAKFDTLLWLTVDVMEQPELLEQIRALLHE